MAITTYQPTSDQVSDVLRDVVYEIEQLLGNYVLRMRLSDPACAPRDQLEAAIQPNVYLEGFLLHFRVLLDFFENSARTRRNGQELDDVLCSDFGFEPASLGLDSNVRGRLNQEVAHLSYSRALRSDESWQWYFGPMIRPMFRRCDSFAEHMLSYAEVNVPDGVSSRLQDIRNAVTFVLDSDKA